MTKPPAHSRRLAILLFVGYASLIAVFQGIGNVLLPAIVESIAPTAKLSTLAMLSTIAAITTVFALICGGALSDRTRSRWGRRTPWLVAMAFASIPLMITMGLCDRLWQLMIVMPALWFTANFYQTVITAILPDRVPEPQRGFASGAMALGVPVGIFVGVNVAAWSPNPLVGYALLAIPFGFATMALVSIDREPSSIASESAVQTYAAGRMLDAFRSRDFNLTFISRFLLFMSYFMVAGYLYYILQDYIGVANLPNHDVARAVGIVLSLATVGWLVIAPLTSLVADRIGHTAGIVAVNSFAIAMVMLVPAFTNQWWGMIAFGIGLGLTFGVFFAIDLKLASLVLPSAERAGLDIGLMGIAASGPTVLAPALAAWVIGFAGHSGLFFLSAIFAVAGGLCAFPIRVRSTVRPRHASATTSTQALASPIS
jgi:MFS family permease